MIVELLVKNRMLRSIIRTAGCGRANDIFRKIGSFLSREEKILDIGAGTCSVTELLREREFNVTPVDIKNLSAVDDIVPVIYDGDTLPFPNNSFDAALLLDVLHHARDPQRVLRESARVAPKIIVIENVHRGKLQKFLTVAMDRLTNLDFGSLNHKSDEGWKDIFSKLGLVLKEEHCSRFWLFFLSKMYLLRRR